MQQFLICGRFYLTIIDKKASLKLLKNYLYIDMKNKYQGIKIISLLFVAVLTMTISVTRMYIIKQKMDLSFTIEAEGIYESKEKMEIWGETSQANRMLSDFTCVKLKNDTTWYPIQNLNAMFEPEQRVYIVSFYDDERSYTPNQVLLKTSPSEASVKEALPPHKSVLMMTWFICLYVFVHLVVLIVFAHRTAKEQKKT